MTTSRRQAREWVVQMLCAADLNPPDDVRAFIDSHWEQFPTLEGKVYQQVTRKLPEKGTTVTIQPWMHAWPWNGKPAPFDHCD